jgi:iron complex outermembrane recepter protein
MKKLFPSLLFLFISKILYAQNINGIVVDAKNNKGISNVTVILKLRKDLSIVATNKTNIKGEFSIGNVSSGTYSIQFSNVGYKSDSKNIQVTTSDINLDTIFLSTNKKQIENVIITKTKELAKVSIDKKTFNVGQDATASGGSAGDVLKNVPGLVVDPNSGSIQIRGNSNVTLLVDGKPSSIFGDDIASALQGIPGSSIESVEVIDKPGAQYDAQGKGGIVNIILKKDRRSGYNGNAGLTIGLPRKINGNIAFNANVKKWNFFINANARYGRSFIKDTIKRTNNLDDTSFLNYAFTNRIPYSGFTNFGLDYNLNKFNKFSIAESFFGADMEGDVNTFTNTLKNNIAQGYNQRINIYNGHPRAATTTFGYKKTFTQIGKEWNVDASYSARQYRRESAFSTDYFDANNTKLPIGTTQNIPVKGGNNNFTISSDFNLPVGKISKFETGVKLIHFAFRSENFPTFSFNGGNIITDVPLKNKFNFTQVTKAAYVNYKSMFHKIQYQFGMRYEHFNYDGYIVQYSKNVGAIYSNVFPSAYLSKKLNAKSDITLSYTKRVNRPNFFQLIPYIDVTNPQDTSMGNPELKPEFVHATELSYMYNYGHQNSLMGSIYYQYNCNLIQQLKRFNANGTSFSQPQNLAFGATYGAEINWKNNILKNWDYNINVNAFNLLLNANEIVGVRNGYGGFAKLITNYKFKNNLDLQLSANYFTRTTITQGYIKPYGNVDIAIKRNFLANKLTLTLNANDIFNTTQTVSIYNTLPAYFQYNFRKNQTQQISIGAQYKFLSKSSNTADIKPKTFGKDGKEIKKDVKNRDENLKKEEGGEGEGNPQQR